MKDTKGITRIEAKEDRTAREHRTAARMGAYAKHMKKQAEKKEA